MAGDPVIRTDAEFVAEAHRLADEHLHGHLRPRLVAELVGTVVAAGVAWLAGTIADRHAA